MRLGLLFYKMMIRPLRREALRTALTVFAVALGVSVVLAIDLAGDAATGSFRSSLETLAGDANLEVTATGGVPDALVGELARLPVPMRMSPRIEDFATIADTKETLPLIGLDLIGEGSSFLRNAEGPQEGIAKESKKGISWDEKSVWVGKSLGRKAGERIRLLINDRIQEYTIAGTYPEKAEGPSAIVMDIAEAQRAVGREGRVDRVLLTVPERDSPEKWERKISEALPEGIAVRAAGTATAENRKMLGAFRWNLRLLSYIALVVGAFLIYNTISVSVVRRRAEIGIVRALGAGRRSVLAAFVGEAALLGLAGATLGLPLGRVMATGAVKLMGATVNALYVSSRPGAVEMGLGSVVTALLMGVGVAVMSAYSPAREAAMISPVEAMARGRREYLVRVHKKRDLWVALALGAAAAIASRMPPAAGKPVFGYLAAVLLIAAAVFAIPALVDLVLRLSSRGVKRLAGVEGLVASRSLGASLRRTSVLVGALCTAVAMMAAVGIMVGSFRETVVQWMGDELPADLYVRPGGGLATDRHPTISPELAARIAKVPGVAAVEALRAYEISYEGMPAELLGADLDARQDSRKTDFLSGRPTREVLDELRGKNGAIVSEPFANKHHVKAGDSVTLGLGEKQATLRIADVCYDYGSERGYILMDRSVMLRYLPDRAPTNLAVHITEGTSAEEVREGLEKATAGYRVLIFSNRDLRASAIQIFDRTFAITYALETVAVLVAVMGVAGALLALVIDRKRELGLLRFLGAAREQVRRMILVEAGLLGLLANIAGMALGFLLSLILIYVINKQSFGWTIRFHWPVAVLLGGLSVVYAATVLAAFYPARVAVRMNPLEALHEE
jgi:putative ABC transport system permease protein